MQKTRGSYQVSEQRRASILKHAFEVFAKNGFRGGSIKQVAELEGISEAGLLHHFNSKSNLLIAVLEYRDDETMRTFTTNEQEDGFWFIESWLSLIARNVNTPGIVELFCILSAEATAQDHPAHEYFKQRYQFSADTVRRNFQKLQKQGRIETRLNAATLAAELIALSDGLQIQWLLDSNLDMLKGHKDFFKRIVAEPYQKELQKILKKY
ncbi:MAG: hypothetical protein RLZZ258_807 [Actinomycetota bacterium]|jgi:AcrR family transcriptional regulator